MEMMVDVLGAQTTVTLVQRLLTARVVTMMTMTTNGGAITIATPHLRLQCTLTVSMIMAIVVTGSE